MTQGNPPFSPFFGATVAIDAARPQALFGWLVRLEESGLLVERLRAQANSDRTLAVEAVLRARGR